jgi:hypothetical protein
VPDAAVVGTRLQRARIGARARAKSDPSHDLGRRSQHDRDRALLWGAVVDEWPFGFGAGLQLFQDVDARVDSRDHQLAGPHFKISGIAFKRHAAGL